MDTDTVYALNGALLEARAETDGSLLWRWQGPFEFQSFNYNIIVAISYFTQQVL